MLLEFWENVRHWLPALLVGLHFVFFWLTIIWILMSKSESQSAVAWCLIVILVPYFGALFFVLFGYQHVHRPLERKRQHLERYRHISADMATVKPPSREMAAHPGTTLPEPLESLRRMAERVGAFPLTFGNHIDFYYEGNTAFAAKLEAIRSARDHIHLEYFIVQPDELGHEVLEALTEKARAGVKVRLLYDAMGSHRLKRHSLEALWQAGGQTSVFLPLNPVRRRFQVNMRNHRKLLIVDGAVGFTGGLNIGDEYLGKDPSFGYWRDTHMRLRGPAVADLQRVFFEDWDFAAQVDLPRPSRPRCGPTISRRAQ